MAFDEDPSKAAETPDEAPLTPASTVDPPVASDASLPARRTGLMVVIAALLLLLVAGVAGAAMLLPLSQRAAAPVKRDAAQDKARIQVAIGVMEALRIYDLEAVKPLLTDSAQKAITAEQWVAAAAASEVPSSTFSPAIWTGEATATVDYNIDGSTGTMMFAPNPAKADVVTMTESGPDGELVYDVELVAAGSGWRVLSLTPKAETFFLDEEFVKSLVETPTP
jgi:hypothetical protein